ncbi:hypothetical protein B0F87_11312 [Methylobacter tundripaludum]|uniref:Uncharacterized protein n=1 Tax=Methylobacter tundripaludum TaxID=173365 RepID=A0A2S6H8Z6_9GAMM|nr:hypothetical protein B0F87_11312 [Methylobacter tundripaludum]
MTAGVKQRGKFAHFSSKERLNITNYHILYYCSLMISMVLHDWQKDALCGIDSIPFYSFRPLAATNEIRKAIFLYYKGCLPTNTGLDQQQVQIVARFALTI